MFIIFNFFIYYIHWFSFTLFIIIRWQSSAYGYRTFPPTICWSVCLSSVLWQNSWLDMDEVWDGRLDGSREEAGSWVWGSVHRMDLYSLIQR